MTKVYLVYYSGWDECLPELMAIKSTKEKADTFITDSIANDTSLSGTIDDFNIDEWELE